MLIGIVLLVLGAAAMLWAVTRYMNTDPPTWVMIVGIIGNLVAVIGGIVFIVTLVHYVFF